MSRYLDTMNVLCDNNILFLYYKNQVCDITCHLSGKW